MLVGHDLGLAGERSAGEPWPSMSSVPIVIRLVGPRLRHPDVSGLLLAQVGQLHADALSVASRRQGARAGQLNSFQRIGAEAQMADTGLPIRYARRMSKLLPETTFAEVF